MTETVGDYVLRRLRDWGVELVFGYPGDGINGLISAFGEADNQPKFVQSRHEEMSAFQAVGYAKFSGAVGAVLPARSLALPCPALWRPVGKLRFPLPLHPAPGKPAVCPAPAALHRTAIPTSLPTHFPMNPCPFPSSITGLVLAGGRALRMGGADKGLLAWRDGRTLVAHALDRLRPQVGALQLERPLPTRIAAAD